MIARFAGGMLGLMAFGVATLSGMIAGNPPLVVLSRALWATLIFCVIGLAVGAAAQAVIDEYMARKEAELFPPEKGDSAPSENEVESDPATTPAMATE